MPNFIHSLDASNIHLLIKLFTELNLKNLNLYTIHDCFATDYKNMAILEILIKKSFSDLYFNSDYLEILHSSFIRQIEGWLHIFKEIDPNGIERKYILIDIDLIKPENMKIIKDLPQENNRVK